MSARKREEDYNKAVGIARMEYDTKLQTAIAAAGVKENSVKLAIAAAAQYADKKKVTVDSIIEDATAIHAYLSEGFDHVEFTPPTPPKESGIVSLNGQ